MKRTRRTLSEEQRTQAWEFKLAVQGLQCVVCGHTHPNMDSHHVVEAAYLRRNHPEHVYDRRNAAPLCPDPCPCHARHTSAFRRIPRAGLLPENEEFAAEALGAYADDYLDRYYATEQAA